MINFMCGLRVEGSYIYVSGNDYFISEPRYRKNNQPGKELIQKDLRLASHLADWMFYARPENQPVQIMCKTYTRLPS